MRSTLVRALVVLAAPVHTATPAATTTQMEHISVVQLGAKGTPVLLIPGLASPRATWAGLAPNLARSHRVFLVQVNGFGGDAPRANATGPVMVPVLDDISAFITSHKLQGAAVIGHSMGGTLGLMLAKAHPEDVGKLMIVDAIPYLPDIIMPGAPPDRVAAVAGGMLARFVQGAASPGYDAQVKQTAVMYGLKPESQAQIAAWTKAANPAVAGQAFYEDLTTDLRPDIATITTPITLVYPWADPTLPKDQADTAYHGWYAKAPRISYVPIGASRHFVMLDQPEEFGKAVDAFLAT